SFVSTPFELLKIKSQMNTTAYNTYKHDGGVINQGKMVYRNSGFLGLYKGFGVTTLRETSAFATQFCVYENIKKRINSANSQNLPNSPNSLNFLNVTSSVIAGG